MGATKQTKGRVGRRPKPPSPPADTTVARLAGDQPDKPPNGHLHRRFSPCCFRLGRGDARGEAPCIRKLKISPFPGGEERSASAGGGIGGRKYTKGRVGRRPKPPSPPADTTAARSAGDQPDKPPQKNTSESPETRSSEVFQSSIPEKRITSTPRSRQQSAP